MDRFTQDGGGPLHGFRVVELGGIGPGPFGGMILADMGAEVIRIDRTGDAGHPAMFPILQRGRRSIAVDLRDADGVDVALRLIDDADAVIEGFRPGVAERLGIGPDVCRERNPRLVYARMTGWGQSGPLAQMPGHDINYLALSGALHAIGPADGDPVVPLNLVGDMGGGGLLLALGVVSALLAAKSDGRGQVVDVAITDGAALQLALVHGLLSQGRWRDQRGVNIFDGTAPFYRTYRCADGKHIAVGCVEPQFYREMLEVLGLAEEPLLIDQRDQAAWAAMTERLAEVFATRTRDEWAEAFDGHETCVTPVLDFAEAAAHPHNVSRETYLSTDGLLAAQAAPRFLGTPSSVHGRAPLVGAHTDDVLSELGLAPAHLEALRARGVVG